MLQTVTTADWLRRAADAWDEADAIQDREARHTKVALAEEYERLAKHAAYLAHYETYARGIRRGPGQHIDRTKPQPAGTGGGRSSENTAIKGRTPSDSAASTGSTASRSFQSELPADRPWRARPSGARASHAQGAPAVHQLAGQKRGQPRFGTRPAR